MESGLQGMRYFLRIFPEGRPDPHGKRYNGSARTGWHMLYRGGFCLGTLRILSKRYGEFEINEGQMPCR
jgi:hypothetical protein